MAKKADSLIPWLATGTEVPHAVTFAEIKRQEEHDREKRAETRHRELIDAISGKLSKQLEQPEELRQEWGKEFNCSRDQLFEFVTDLYSPAINKWPQGYHRGPHNIDSLGYIRLQIDKEFPLKPEELAAYGATRLSFLN